MSIVVGSNLSHPALLPPTPPYTPGTLSPENKKHTLALPLAAPIGATVSPQPRSPLAPTIPNPHKQKPSASASPAATGGKSKIAPPVPCYSMLRAQHATAIRYVLAKLRWDQTHSGYIPGCDPWEKIAIVIAKLEEELAGVEAAQQTLDKWPNCHYPIARVASKVKQHGPPSYEQLRAEEEEEVKRERALDKQLFAQFPFLKPAIIGPRTKAQQKAHFEMRKVIFEGEFYMDDLEEMMPDENLKALLAGEDPDPYGDRRKKQPQPPLGYKMRKLTYDEVRCERENAKIAKQLEEKGIEVPTPPEKKKQRPIGPMTKEEYMASLPKYGPKTKAEAMLPVQREQRQVILTWLKQPWATYDEEAAGLMHKLGTLAFVRMEEKGKAAKGGGGGARRPSGVPPPGAVKSKPSGTSVKEKEKADKKKEEEVETKDKKEGEQERGDKKTEEAKAKGHKAVEGDKAAEKEVRPEDVPGQTAPKVERIDAVPNGDGAKGGELEVEIDVMEIVEVVDLPLSVHGPPAVKTTKVE